jgi:glycosyltransferase involved in cell wall biosynthesis
MKRPLKVALISTGLGRELRGVETWMADLAQELPDTVRPELWPGGRFVSPRPDRPSRRIGGISRNHPWLRSSGWSERYSWEQHTAIPGALLRLLVQRPDVAYVADPTLAWNLKRFRSWHRTPIVFLNGMRLSPRWCASFDGVHVLAPAYLKEAAAMMPGQPLTQFFSVPHFTDVVRFRPPSAAERRSAREAFGIPADAFVVLAIGPVGTASGKRVDHVASALARASSRALLVSAGADEEGAEAVRGRIAAALGPRARLLGRVPRERMHVLHQTADLFALGTLGEPFSIAIAEALATGVPVVHHRDPVTDWVAEAGGVAVSMADADAELLVAVLRRLESDAGERGRLGAAGRALAESRYAPAVVCAALEREWRRIASLGNRS